MRAFAAVWLVVHASTAQPRAETDETAITAEALFEAGRMDVQRGEYASACPKFAESQRLDPAAGTLINLADCEEHLGHLARAWQLWREAVERLPPDDARRAVVLGRANAVDARVPRLTIKLAPGVPIEASVRRNDVELGGRLLDVPLPLDPGQHVIVLTVPGFIPTRYVVTLAEAARTTLVLELGPMDSPARSPGRASSDGPSNHDAAAHDAAAPSYFGIGLLGLGAIGIGTGLVTGVLAIDKKDQQERNCYPAKVCSPAGADAAESGRTLAVVSTLGFIVGGAAALGGLYLVLRNRAQRSPAAAALITPLLFPGGAGLGVARSL